MEDDSETGEADTFLNSEKESRLRILAPLRQKRSPWFFSTLFFAATSVALAASFWLFYPIKSFIRWGRMKGGS
jgi:hypothetical protein